MQVLIVAKTFMKNTCCIGAFNLNENKNIRLLTSSSENQPFDTEFNIGQIWEVDFIERPNIISPHREDVLVKNATFLKKQLRLNDYLIDNMPIIWKGNPDNIFGGKIKFPIGQSGYLEQINAGIDHSVGFWLPDKDLELTIFEDNKHYFYFGDNQVYAFPYVGTVHAIDKIRKGSLIRLSLARWWSPDSTRYQKRCYCQLSGWYDN
ncbi:MAG: dual OB domain-containing protein [Bacteroidales bacterium]